ncbi:MAG TPA: T9SS type A sorting domain-containing protein [Prolixibacteraceae bacterium]|jgi:hypothetical protein
MKTLFTFILILIIGTSSYGQKTIYASQKLASVDRISTDVQSFSIEKLYPNPVKDLLTVDLRSAQSGDIQISLINILGTEVKKWDEFLPQGDQKLRLDLSQFKSGMYILKIIQQNQVRTQVLKKI